MRSLLPIDPVHRLESHPIPHIFQDPMDYKLLIGDIDGGWNDDGGWENECTGLSYEDCESLDFCTPNLHDPK